ncbi:MAG: alpha/beta fold hydrolase [Pseudobutyrivibrio sp.]|nr:alpha/beta fold hydrolase [Pseudobutyrivibrio sp.]
MKQFFIEDDGIKLNAMLDMPVAQVDKCPLCLVFHGFTGNSEEEHLEAVVKAMNKVGVATLRVDLYGHGKSGGEFKNHNIYKWLNNILTVADYAKGLDFVTDLYICGHSQGGLAVTLAAAMEGSLFKAMIPMSPAYIIPSGARAGWLLGKQFDPDNIPDEITEFDEFTLSGNYVKVAQTIDVQKAINKYKGKVLLVHGDNDETIPVSVSVDAAKQFADCELKIIVGADHCYIGQEQEAAEAVKNFLKKFIKYTLNN